MIDKSWMKSLGIALSLPSTILASAILSKKLVDNNIMTWGYSALIFVFIVGSMLFLMVLYSYKNKK